MQNPLSKLKLTSIIFKKPGFLSEKSRTFTSSNYHRVQYFLVKFPHVFYLVMSTKGCAGFFFILFRSWVICKKLKRPGLWIVFQMGLVPKGNNERELRYTFVFTWAFMNEKDILSRNSRPKVFCKKVFLKKTTVPGSGTGVFLWILQNS